MRKEIPRSNPGVESFGFLTKSHEKSEDEEEVVNGLVRPGSSSEARKVSVIGIPLLVLANFVKKKCNHRLEPKSAHKGARFEQYRQPSLETIA